MIAVKGRTPTFSLPDELSENAHINWVSSRSVSTPNYWTTRSANVVTPIIGGSKCAQVMKRLIRLGPDMSLPEAQTIEQEALFDLFAGENGQGRINAFLDNCAPKFSFRFPGLAGIEPSFRPPSHLSKA